MSAQHVILVRAFHLSKPAGGEKQLGQAHPRSLHGRDGRTKEQEGNWGLGTESHHSTPQCAQGFAPQACLQVECWVHLIAHIFSNPCVFLVIQSTTRWCWVGWGSSGCGAGGAELSCSAHLDKSTLQPQITPVVMSGELRLLWIWVPACGRARCRATGCMHVSVIPGLLLMNHEPLILHSNREAQGARGEQDAPAASEDVVVALCPQGCWETPPSRYRYVHIFPRY